MNMEESCFPDDYVNIRIQANTSYQIKRVIAQLEKEKGLVLMSISGILPNTGRGPRLRMFATFRDLKFEKKRKIKRFSKEQVQKRA